jgi:hypothetical protein
MNPHREWLCEYEKCDRGNVFLCDESTTKIIGRGKVKLRLIDGRIRILPGFFHILELAIIYFCNKNGRWRGTNNI